MHKIKYLKMCSIKPFQLVVMMLITALTLCSCSKSPEERAQTLFGESIKAQMGSPELYEFIQMTKN
jgi:hypothetical protein